LFGILRDISLDLYKKSSTDLPSEFTHGDEKTNNQNLKLEDCLKKFTLPETVTSFNCSNCKCVREAKKQLTMKNLPIVCCFHLKRFEQTNKIHKKISDHILFPEILDMTPYLSSLKNSNAENSEENNNNQIKESEK
jgi:ubiquitin carboxyl-terminal hydrolase 22/27/51